MFFLTIAVLSLAACSTSTHKHLAQKKSISSQSTQATTTTTTSSITTEIAQITPTNMPWSISYSQQLNRPFNDPFAAIACGSVFSCWAAGQSGYLLKTLNSGKSWNEVPLSVALLNQLGGHPQEINSISCPDATTCYATTEQLGSQGAQSGYGAVIKKSVTDPNWSLTKIFSGTSKLYSIVCPTENNCLIGGINKSSIQGEVITTDDGFQTQFAYPLKQASPFVRISCSNPISCIAISPSNTLFTLDLKNWNQVLLPQNISYLTDVGCDSASFCLAVAQISSSSNVYAVLISKNAGESFSTASYLPSSYVVNGITCLNSKACYMVGYLENSPGTAIGFVLFTNDQGASFESQQLPSQVTQITSISCSTNLLCFATGTNLPTTPINTTQSAFGYILINATS